MAQERKRKRHRPSRGTSQRTRHAKFLLTDIMRPGITRSQSGRDLRPKGKSTPRVKRPKPPLK